MRLCDFCGGEVAPRPASHIRGRVFCSKSCSAKSRTGARNPNYNGGLSRLADGRALIVARDGAHVLFYRAVMEAHLRRHLTSDEIVHHINGDHTDDRLENLELTTRAEHIETHRADLMAGWAA